MIQWKEFTPSGQFTITASLPLVYPPLLRPPGGSLCAGERMVLAAHPDYVEERNGRYLYFWGDYPHWIITNESGHKILNLLFKGTTPEQVSSLYRKETSLSKEEATEDLHHFLDPLVRTGIVYETPPVLLPVKRQFSVEDAVCRVTSVVVNPTRACNYRCSHCYTNAATPHENELSSEEILHILKQISPFMHVKILGFLGGEPLLRKEDVLRAAEYWTREEGGYASVSTNGSLIDPSFAERAARANLAVQVSVDGATPQTCDAVRGEGSFHKAVEGTRTLVRHGALSFLCMVYHRGNVHELEAFIQLGMDLGVRGVRFIPYNYLGRGAESSLVKVMPLELVKRVHTILRTHPDWGDFIDQSIFGNMSVIVRTAPRYVYCGSGLSTLLVDSNGDIYPCINLVHPELKVGNARTHPFADLWVDSPVLRRIRSLCVEEGEKCHSCLVRYMCGMGCRAEIYALTKRLDLPAFFCNSWRKALVEMCWVMDEFPHLHERVTAQREGWSFQQESLVDEEGAHALTSRICG